MNRTDLRLVRRALQLEERREPWQVPLETRAKLGGQSFRERLKGALGVLRRETDLDGFTNGDVLDERIAPERDGHRMSTDERAKRVGKLAEECVGFVGRERLDE